jgi:hypothetical protein
MKEAWSVWHEAAMDFEWARIEVPEFELSLDDKSLSTGVFWRRTSGLVAN